MGFIEAREEAVQLVVRGVRRPVRLEEPESSLTDRREAMVFRAHAPPHGVCDYMINTLKLLANQQLGGDRLVEVLVEDLQERSRLKMMDELRRFIMEDNHEAVILAT